MSAATSTPEPVVVDLRPMMPPQRHATVFAALDALVPGATFVLINDHAPIPLLRRIEESWPDRFEIEFLRDGPEVWQVAITRTPDPAPVDDPAALTRHIETRYHQRHREQLPELAALAAKVETAHAGNPDAPAGLAALLKKLIGELEVHMKKEELILFPAIRRGGAGAGAPIAAMRADHDDHASEITEIRRLTAGLTLPEGACRTWTALYEGLDSFVADLEEHIHLENDVLFPRFEEVA